LVIVGVGGINFSLRAQEKVEEQVASISGEVVAVDLAKSEVVVKQLVADTYKDIPFAVSTETKIQKGSISLEPSELKAGDKVTVKYTIDTLGKQMVESITVEAE
jgi:hypothetical protein